VVSDALRLRKHDARVKELEFENQSETEHACKYNTNNCLGRVVEDGFVKQRNFNEKIRLCRNRVL
jgi:hypothetical protein